MAIFAAALVVATLIALVMRRREPLTGHSAETTELGASATVVRPSSSTPARTIEPARAAPQRATLGWGSGPGQIGRPAEEEGEAETPLRLAADGAGDLVLLDNANGRFLRVGSDGGVGHVPLSIKPRDVAATKDGLAFLDEGGVTLAGPDGRTRGKLPLPPNASSMRSVVVSGDDVYVESSRGQLTRIGDVRGNADPNPAAIPGQPTRDGRGFLKALVADQGSIHVFVVDRGSLKQRFSRQMQLPVFVEGIFLIDTDRAGTIYLGVTGSPPQGSPATTVALLACLEPEHGELIGTADLPVDVGPEVVLDAKALDQGGVAYSVHSSNGVRLERHGCNNP